jgi:hypothetical protein
VVAAGSRRTDRPTTSARAPTTESVGLSHPISTTRASSADHAAQQPTAGRSPGGEPAAAGGSPGGPTAGGSALREGGEWVDGRTTAAAGLAGSWVQS